MSGLVRFHYLLLIGISRKKDIFRGAFSPRALYFRVVDVVSFFFRCMTGLAGVAAFLGSLIASGAFKRHDGDVIGAFPVLPLLSRALQRAPPPAVRCLAGGAVILLVLPLTSSPSPFGVDAFAADAAADVAAAVLLQQLRPSLSLLLSSSLLFTYGGGGR